MKPSSCLDPRPSWFTFNIGSLGRSAAWSLAALAMTMAGCGGAPAALAPPALDGGKAAELALQAFDKNQDQKISRAEAAASPSLLAAFVRGDRDQDKALSKAELEARVQSYGGSGVGLMMVELQVYAGGAPIANATIELTPAEFLGPAIKAAAGQTSALGSVNPSIPAAELPDPTLQGVHCGLYTVTVRSGSGPAQTAGVEIAADMGLPVVRLDVK